ncbi:MAG TPA: hypothetical protein VHN99_06845 [Deinococcales bacterium]|nr:hypothetical protein [Deinococcales bacterium]
MKHLYTRPLAGLTIVPARYSDGTDPKQDTSGGTGGETPATLEAAQAALKAAQEEAAKLAAKYEKAQADLGKFRTRASELEEAKKAAEDAARAKLTTEERLKVFEQKLAEQEQALKQRDEALALATVRSDLIAAGVAPERLEDALALYATAKAKANPEEPLTVQAFLEARPYLVGATNGMTTPAGGTKLPTGAGSTASNTGAKSVKELAQEKLRTGEYRL